jgi:hypothetical protein
MRLPALVLALLLLSACRGDPYCKPDCRKDLVYVDAGVTAECAPVCSSTFCNTICPAGYRYGWGCDSVGDGGVLCRPNCPC